MDFADRVRLIAGASPYAWAARKKIPKGTMRSWLSGAAPQAKSLQILVEKTGIPEDWWLSGDGPPPAPRPALEIVPDSAALPRSGSRAYPADDNNGPYKVAGAIVGGKAVEADELRKLVAHVDRWATELQQDGVTIDPDFKAEIVVFAWQKLKGRGYDAAFVTKLLQLAAS